MQMKLSRKGLLAHIVKPEFDAVSDRSTAQWKPNDLKVLGMIAGDVSLIYQVYIRGATTAAEAWRLLEEQFNRNTLKNRLIVTKKLHNFKMEPGTRFAVHVDRFKELVLQMETIGEALGETRQLVLLLGSLTAEYRMIKTVLENTPNMTLAKKPGHKESECRKKKADEERGQVARETSDFAFTATGAMEKSEWLVDSGASLHMTSVRDKFVSMKELKVPVCITIADGTKIDAVATGTVGLKLMDGTTVTLSDVLYTPEIDGGLISAAKLAEKNVFAQFSKEKCVFRYREATVMEAKRSGNVYKLKTVGGEVCRAATTPRKEPWAIMHARLGHIPYKRYEQLLSMADGVPRIADDTSTDNVCAGCCMGKMRAYDFPRHPANLVKSTSVLELMLTDVMGSMQTRSPGGCTYAVTSIDDYSRHVTVYFMKAKSEVLSKFKIFKAAMENATGKAIKRLRSDNGGGYTDKAFKTYLDRSGIKHEKTVPYTPQQNGLAEPAWIINRIPNSINVKTPYEIVYRTKPQLKNMKVFGSLGYAHIPDEKRRKLDPKVFKCRFVGYEDRVKGYRVLNVATGKVQIVRTVKFMETTDPDQLMNCLEMDEDGENGDSECQPEFLPPLVPASDVTSIVEARRQDMTHHDDPRWCGNHSVDQARAKADDEQLVIEGGMLMAATEEIPRSNDEATTSNNRAKWKAAIERELSSLMTNNTRKLIPRPKHQRAIGCRWVFALKRDETGRIVRHKARLVAKGYSQRHGIDYEETYSPVASLNSIRANLANFCEDGAIIEQCDVDTAFLYGELEEEIYMELQDGLMEVLGDTDDGDEDLVCLLEKCLYGLKQAYRV
ncbi:unnamed protein product [Phytophthora fragariaefolia]|uniref:Unnamed protein product n=1 Tax=Phytophthora fragariaefolia TaxID=1490495 RepID=A0A9W6Y1Q3_9STRA|nr:unnamed protein product [Phytophthora fragariaefolia]